MKPLLGAAVSRSSAGLALPVYLTLIAARAVTPGFEVSAQMSLKARSLFRSSALGSSRVRSAAIVSPDWCALPSVGVIAAGTALATVPELIATPRAVAAVAGAALARPDLDPVEVGLDAAARGADHREAQRHVGRHDQLER